MAQVLYHSTPQPFDQLVRLHLGIFPVFAQYPPSVQLVVFEDMNTIPELLRSRSTKHQDHGVDVTTVIGVDRQLPGGKEGFDA